MAVFFAAAGMAAGGIIEDWNEAFLNAVRKEAPPPCLVSRNLPIFHLAIHRAAGDVGNAGQDEAAQICAADHAAHRVYLTFFPSQTMLVEEVRARNSDVLGKAEGKTHSWRALADAAVIRTLKEREGDGSATTMHYVPNDKPGHWRRTPPHFRPPEFPHWGKVKPFAVDDVTRFRAPPPPELGSPAYARNVNEVREIGSIKSPRRTEEQTLIAQFWADFSYTTSPAGHWNEIAREICRERKLPLAESSLVFAVLNVTLADTCIAIWDTKYHYNYWRPVTAIQRADEDGNEVTAADKSWQSLLPCPPHPEYVSGHSGISGAAATVMKHFFGEKDVYFEARSDDVPGERRAFTSFGACADEIALSRVYGGLHYPCAGREGLRMGRKIAVEVLKTFK